MKREGPVKGWTRDGMAAGGRRSLGDASISGGSQEETMSDIQTHQPDSGQPWLQTTGCTLTAPVLVVDCVPSLVRNRPDSSSVFLGGGSSSGIH